MQNFDVIVVGGGPAGYNSLGGTCLNVGCIPTKTFLYAGKMYHYASGAGEAYGVTAEGPVHVDQAAVVEKKDEVVKMLVQGVGSALSLIHISEPTRPY